MINVGKPQRMTFFFFSLASRRSNMLSFESPLLSTIAYDLLPLPNVDFTEFGRFQLKLVDISKPKVFVDLFIYFAAKFHDKLIIPYKYSKMHFLSKSLIFIEREPPPMLMLTSIVPTVYLPTLFILLVLIAVELV